MKKYIIIFYVTFSFSFCFSADNITVDVSQTINVTTGIPLGINVNYYMDDDSNRTPARTFIEALTEVKPGYIRYPGGEKSDANLWSVPPYTQANPRLARTGSCEWPSGDTNLISNFTEWIINPLDFDEFMNICQNTGAEPVIVVCYDSMYKGSSCGGTTPTRAQLEETAVEWVRYANITKGYNVKYWEIGNESYLDSYNGTATAQDYGKDLIRFSDIMKAIDPSIKIGANGDPGKGNWWEVVLTTASPYIDFLVVHEYPCWQWNNYEYYRTHTPDLIPNVHGTINAINTYVPAEHRDRLFIAVTEMNSADWASGGWPHVNNTGHAIVLAEMIGEFLKQPKVRFSLLWNTRWMNNNNANPPELWDALDKYNMLYPTGKVLSIWAQNLKRKIVSATSTSMVRCFASYDSDKSELILFLINKDTAIHQTQITINNYILNASGIYRVFKGTGSEDCNPVYSEPQNIVLAGNKLNINLEPVSFTLVCLSSTTGTPSPLISVSQSLINFGEVPLGKKETLPFEIVNEGGGILSGVITTTSTWIRVEPETFEGNNTVVNVTVDNGILKEKQGEFSGIIFITSNGGDAQVLVTLSATCVLVKPNPYNPNKGPLTFFGSGVIPGKTLIKIYSIEGKKISDGYMFSSSRNEIYWDGKDEKGNSVLPGIYIYTYESPEEKGIGKFTIKW